MSYDYRIESDGRHHIKAQRQRRDRPTEYRDSYADISGPRGNRQMELVRRTREDSDVEEIPRDFPPPGGVRRQRARSDDRSRDYYAGAGYGGRNDRGRGDDHRGSRGRSLSRAKEAAAVAGGAGLALGANELWERRDGGKHRQRSKSRVRQAAIGVAGAVAGDVAARQYSKRHGEDHHHHHDERRTSGGRAGAAAYYGDGDYDDSRGRPKPSRRKSLSEAAIGALGLKELLGHDDPRGDRGRRRRHRSSSSYGSSRSSSPDRLNKYQTAAKAALLAAGAEAWRSRKDPGGFFEGPKARRIFTAAAGAGGINGLADKHPDQHTGRDVGAGALGGLLLNRAVNGSRKDDYSRSRSRSRRRSRGGRGSDRSRSRGGGLKDLAGAAVAAGVGKKLFDKVRSRSRSRNRRYSSSESSVSPRPRNRRSRSVSEYFDRGMNKLGLGAATAAGAGAGAAASHRKDRDDDHGRARGAPRDAPRGAVGAARGGSETDTDSEFSLEEEERNRRKMRGKEFLTAGLATVATVHAAHEVYEGFEKRQMRQKMVREGDMSPEESRRLKYKSNAKDAATVGLAALGIKGVVDNWKDMQEQRKQCHEFETRLERHRRKDAERQLRGQQQGLGSTDSWRHSDPNLAGNGYNGGSGPVYQDGNPYAAGGGSRRY
ncbi:MAG: hypothetical protein M1817_001639 [Caeruleum heppii]|nr:MAG: hypothetical protein M1817_001639 [Caeruleum heppii]